MTTDDDGRIRVEPGTRLTRRDRWIPYMHGKWWNFDLRTGATKTTEQLYAELTPGDPADVDGAKATLDHVEAIARSAVDRADAADRRATTIAGTVSIAASLTLGGASLVLDKVKLQVAGERIALACMLLVTVLLFVVSAAYALRALVWARRWYWSNPHHLDGESDAPLVHQFTTRSVYLLQDFAGNWEISDFKNRNVDRAFWTLGMALAGLILLAGIIAASAR